MKRLILLVFFLSAVFVGPALLGSNQLVIDEREVIAIDDFPLHGDEFKYMYRGETLPDKLDDRELVEKRKDNSYTIVNPDGTLTTRIYSDEAYHQNSSGGWSHVEYGLAKKTDLPLAHRIVETVRAATEAPFSEAGDGYVGASSNVSQEFCTTDTPWSTVYNAVTGTASYTGTTFIVTSTVTANYFAEPPPPNDICSALIRRGFVPFDTSGIPSGGIISAATISLYVTATSTSASSNYYITLATSTQASHSSLTSTDYDEAGPKALNDASKVIDVADEVDVPSISINAYLDFDFNSNGLNAIKKSGESSTCSSTNGITCIAVRTGHDADNSPPGTDVSRTTSVTFSSSEETGTSQDPYLTVTYAAEPTVTTDAASSVTDSSATLNGNITSGASITQHGFAWGTNSSLSGGDTATTTLGAGSTGAYSEGISSLDPNTTYYFRAYATNSEGTGYGTIASFTTSTNPPTVTTNAATSVAKNSATINGEITATGGENANERGFAWGTNSSLSGGDTATTTSFGSFGTGTFSENLFGLSQGATYYFRAYVANTAGTSTGSILNFTTTAVTKIIRLTGGIRLLGGVRLY